MSKISEINENSNAKYYRVYKEIKKDNQGLFNTPKNIYIMSKTPKDRKFKSYNFLEIEKTKIKQFPINMIIETNYISQNNLDILLNYYNKPIQHKYFPANIENIVFIIPNDYMPEYRHLIEIIKNKIHKVSDEGDYHHTLFNEFDQGEIDSEEYTTEEE